MAAARWWVILNGKCSAGESVREAVQAFRARGIDIAVRVTWERGDIARFVDEALNTGCDVVIAAGGDGTLSEVATALAHRDEAADALPAIGILPLGTANDFATAAQMPTLAMDALELVHTGVPRAMDLLRITADDGVHWCANLASGGFGTQVTLQTDEGLKKMLGGLAYLVTGVSQLGRIEHIRARVHGPGFEWQGDFIALGIGNGRQAGGGQALCPDALVDDGLLDVTVVPELVGEVGATFGTLVTQGKHAALERVAIRERLPWVQIDPEDPFQLNLDGEPVTAGSARIDCVAGRVRVILPVGCPLLGTPGTQQPVASVDVGDAALPPGAVLA